MTIFQAALLGVVQGATEFLPVSSSGHLVVFRHLLSFGQPQLTFDVLVHFATLLAIVVFFWQEIAALKTKTLGLLVVGMIPAGVVGLLVNSNIEALFGSIQLVSTALIVTGLINLMTDRMLGEGGKKNSTTASLDKMTLQQALIVGIFQMFAIVPGISRSGSTLFGGIWQKLDRKTAFTLSFLLAIPAIGGASLLQVLEVSKVGFNSVMTVPFLAGAITAFASGYASLWIFKKVLTNARLEVFGWYCVVVGSLLLASQVLI